MADGSRILFNAAGLQTAAVDPQDNQTTLRYDSNDRMTSLTDSQGRQTQLIYSGDHLEKIIDPASRTTTLAHDAAGNLVSIVDSDNTRRAFAYDDNRLVEQISKGGLSTAYTYGWAGRLERINRPNGAQLELGAEELGALLNMDAGVGTKDNPGEAKRPEDIEASMSMDEFGEPPTDLKIDFPKDGGIITVGRGESTTKINVGGSHLNEGSGTNSVSINQTEITFVNIVNSGATTFTSEVLLPLGPNSFTIAVVNESGLASEKTVEVFVEESDEPNQAPIINDCSILNQTRVDAANGSFAQIGYECSASDADNNLASVTIEKVPILSAFQLADATEDLVAFSGVVVVPMGEEAVIRVTATDDQGQSTTKDIINPLGSLGDLEGFSYGETIPANGTTVSVADLETPHTINTFCSLELENRDLVSITINDTPILFTQGDVTNMVHFSGQVEVQPSQFQPLIFKATDADNKSIEQVINLIYEESAMPNTAPVISSISPPDGTTFSECGSDPGTTVNLDGSCTVQIEGRVEDIESNLVAIDIDVGNDPDSNGSDNVGACNAAGDAHAPAFVNGNDLEDGAEPTFTFKLTVDGACSSEIPLKVQAIDKQGNGADLFVKYFFKLGE